MPQHAPAPEQTSVRISLGRRIRQIRRTQGISQEELAHRSGLDRSYVGCIERGERNVSIDNITSLARALDVPIATLLTFSEETDPR
jgi:transcriptional regulator with XRE-family HTH domain